MWSKWHHLLVLRSCKELGKGCLSGSVMCGTEVVVGARRIRIEKLREHQYREGYVRPLDGKGVEWNGDDNVQHMWEQVKRAMVESAREVCSSMRVGKQPKECVV